MEVRELQRIDAIAAADWNALAGTDCPFLRHEFLAALEHCGCVGGSTGWTPAQPRICSKVAGSWPRHRCIARRIPGANSCSTSAGRRRTSGHGLPYYPKLLLAVPFSPVNSARLLLAPDLPAAPLREQLLREVMARC